MEAATSATVTAFSKVRRDPSGRDIAIITVSERPGRPALAPPARHKRKSAVEPRFVLVRQVLIGTRTAVPSLLRHARTGIPGRRDWTRTNDPHHVKVVL